MRKNRSNSIALLFVLPLAFLWQGSSCQSPQANSHGNSIVNASPTSQSSDLRGQWGGQHIAMEVTDSGATIEYDCAHGRITEKIVLNAEGKFEAKGVHAPERGGPTRQDENNEQPAVYRGSIKDDTMTVTVELTQNNENLGEFTLTHGKPGRIRKCL